MCLSCGCLEPQDNHQDSRNITIVDLRSAADAAGIGLDQAARNILTTIGKKATKSAAIQSAFVSCQVVKSSAESRYTLGLAYPAMKPDVAMAADGHRDFVGAETLEKTAWEWMAKHRDINLFHKSGTSGHGTVVESYIYRGPDWEIQSPVDDKPYKVQKGDWLMGSIWDPYAWDLINKGLVNGWSPEGMARRSEPSAERLADLRS